MNLFILVFLALIQASNILASNKCHVLYQSFYPELSITEVERHDTATIVHMRRLGTPGEEFVLRKQKYYLDDELGRKYVLKGIDSITQGDTIQNPLSGIIDFRLIFEPLEKNVKIFDLRATNEWCSLFAFWGIHEDSGIRKKIKSVRDENIRLDKKDIAFGAGKSVVKGHIRNYAPQKPDTFRLQFYTENESWPGTHQTLIFKSAVSQEGDFEFQLTAENMSWAHIEAGNAYIPLMLYPNDTLYVTIDRLREVGMSVDYRSQAGNNVMQNLMKADPYWMDGELVNTRYVPARPSVLKEDMMNRKKKAAILVDYLAWKHKMSLTEAHLLRLQIHSFINAIHIARMGTNMERAIHYKQGEYTQKIIADYTAMLPELQDDYDFLQEIDTKDYSYFVLPRQSIIANLYYAVKFPIDNFSTLEKYIGKPLNEDWRSRINLKK